MADVSISRLLTATIKTRTATMSFNETFVGMNWTTTSSLEDIFDISMPTLTASLNFLLTNKSFFESIIAGDEIEVTSNISGGLTLYLTVVSCNIVYSKGEVDIQCSAGWLTESPKFKGIVQLVEENWEDTQARYGIGDVEYHRKTPPIQIAVEAKGDFALGVANAYARPAALALTPFTISSDVRDWYPIPGYNPFTAGWYQHKGLAVIPTFESALERKFAGLLGYVVSEDNIVDYRFSSAHEPVTHVVTRSAGKIGPAPLVDLSEKSSAKAFHIPQRGLSAMYASDATTQELHWTDGVVTSLPVASDVRVAAILPEYYITLDSSTNKLEAHSRYDASETYLVKDLTANESNAIRMAIQASNYLRIIDELPMPESHVSGTSSVLGSYHLWFDRGQQIGGYPNEEFMMGLCFQVLDNATTPVVLESMVYVTHAERVQMNAGASNTDIPYYLGSTVVKTDSAYVSTKGTYAVQALFSTSSQLTSTAKDAGICYCTAFVDGYVKSIQVYDFFTPVTSLTPLSTLTEFGLMFSDSCASCQVPTTYEATMLAGSILYNSGSSWYYFVFSIGDSGLVLEQLAPPLGGVSNRPYVYFVDVPMQPTERQSVLASIIVIDRVGSSSWGSWVVFSHSGATDSNVSWYKKYVDILGSGSVLVWDPDCRSLWFRRNLLFNITQTPPVYRLQLGGSPFSSRTIGEDVYTSKLRSGRRAELQMPFRVGRTPLLPTDLSTTLGKLELDITGFTTGQFVADLSALHVIPLGGLLAVKFPTEKDWTYTVKVTSYSLRYDGLVSATVSGIVVGRTYTGGFS